MPSRSYRIHPAALLIALPIIPALRSWWYMGGEGWGRTLDYFVYTVSEGWPFWVAYLVAVVIVSLVFQPGRSDELLDK